MNKQKAGKITTVIAVGIMAVVGATTIAASVAQPCDSLRLYIATTDDRMIDEVTVGFSQYPHATVREVWRGSILNNSIAHIAIGAGRAVDVYGNIHLTWRDARGEIRHETIELDSEMAGVTVHAMIAGSTVRHLRSYDMWPRNIDTRGFFADWLTMGRILRCAIRS